MCDCYGHKCECCDELVPMHIGDFKYPRSDFKAWCEKHIDQAQRGAVIFEVTETWEDAEEEIGWRCAILGPEVGGKGDNSPNTGCEMKETKVSRGKHGRT